jgi:hypothetical protein
MKKAFACVGAVVLAAGVALAMTSRSEAAPAQSMLPGLETLGSVVTTVDCRRYRHCHTRCTKRKLGICVRSHRYCHRC